MHSQQPLIKSSTYQCQENPDSISRNDIFQNGISENAMRPLLTTIKNRFVSVHFLKHNGLWLWLFNRPSGGQSCITESEVAEFLLITERTAQQWRKGHRKPCQIALLLLHLNYTGQIVPEEWSRKGYGFKEKVLINNGAEVHESDLGEMNYLRWQLAQQTALIKTLYSRPQRHESESKTIPPPQMPNPV